MNNLFYDLPEDIQTKIMKMKQEIEDSENNMNESDENDIYIICHECEESFIPEEMEEIENRICRTCLRDNHSIDLDY